ncbi:hypothetical protein DVA86_33890 [Streptomyces armeniacus]|uniref:DUF8094 domain-containing protein n=1 Tax=Streptomyces armeniacus TaxID=83291 RepID=A0A345XYT1_9ACTN|nr:hypothetical protein [Streptomyces armeniacus]AXK36797.1 hypothetical protein DVA86_33890 [Streptomyces armeniacus]
MKARLLAATTTAAVLSATLSGCITVHGEDAVIPAVGKGEARKVLDEFTAVNNKSNKTYDAGLNATVEAGALGAIDQAGLKSRKKVHPEGNDDFDPLKFSDSRFLIPKQAGWPKFFVADTKSNRGSDGRWFLLFQRDSADAKWKATYLAVLDPADTPEFAVGKDGYAKAVPDVGGGEKLAVEPDKISKAYARYLQEGEGEFAAGAHTSKWREEREKTAEKPGVRTEWADTPAVPPQFAPFGLRTKDGGAMLFFATHHHKKQTVAEGYTPQVKDPYVKALMTGTPKKSLTYVRVSEQAVTVPPAKKGGEITFLSRIAGLTSVKAE